MLRFSNLSKILILAALTIVQRSDSKGPAEQTCNFDIIVPRKEVLKQCDAFAEQKLKPLRRRLEILQGRVQKGNGPTRRVDLFEKCTGKTPQNQRVVFESCEETRRSGIKDSGVYELHNVVSPSTVFTELYPNRTKTTRHFARVKLANGTKAFCQIELDHGWTVVMRRKNMDVNFNRTWKEYKYGFGNLSANEDFWWGLENIYRMTNQQWRTYLMRVEIITSGNVIKIGDFRRFKLNSEDKKYSIVTVNYNYGTSNSTSNLFHSRVFQTWDKWDKRSYSYGSRRKNCVTLSDQPYSGGGWWFQDNPTCLSSYCLDDCGNNLNAVNPYVSGWNITSVIMKLRLYDGN